MVRGKHHHLNHKDFVKPTIKKLKRGKSAPYSRLLVFENGVK